ncbi:hypothetical protein C1646_707635 [Rhizophagus diaphanus]|nr:hypothetical protein C1646_707635 [Rhizophagus diaphanus] [Rhizophagus sp. MUCL 43196]
MKMMIQEKNCYQILLINIGSIMIMKFHVLIDWLAKIPLVPDEAEKDSLSLIGLRYFCVKLMILENLLQHSNLIFLNISLLRLSNYRKKFRNQR